MQKWFKPGSAFNDTPASPPLTWQSILAPFYLVVVMWLVYWLDQRMDWELYRWGVFPGTWSGLRGVLLAPLLHGSFTHLLSNTFPILVLGIALFHFYTQRAWSVLAIAWLSSGLAVWLMARESFHIGASGLVYALATFIFVSGLLRSKANLLALSLLVVFIYGSLFWGLLPIEEAISYEGHVAGAASGLVLALLYRKVPIRQGRSAEAPKEELDEDLSREIALYGEAYWKQGGEENKSGVVYHYLPQIKNEKHDKSS